jgi:hypothetical protein
MKGEFPCLPYIHYPNVNNLVKLWAKSPLYFSTSECTLKEPTHGSFTSINGTWIKSKLYFCIGTTLFLGNVTSICEFGDL